MPDPIIVVPYDVRWPDQFAALSRDLRKALGAVAVRIDHVGSTAVPNLAAKPVIDIQISVAAFDPLDAFRLPLESLGLVFHAENPDLTKRYFRERPGTARTHIHVREAGTWSEQVALLFRDYLRQHPEQALDYARHKLLLAERFRDDRSAYTEAKSPTIWRLLSRAHVWSMEMGWRAGPSDA